ncbi:MAG: RluA family pseudouridine synthase [Pirellula sp.]
MHILHEDNHLLVINKPADWIVQGALPSQQSILDWAANYLGTKYSKPGKVFVGVVSRLDSPVTGVLPLARTSKSASRLSEQFRAKTPIKTYWAIVENCPAQEMGRLEHFLVRREQDTTTRVVSTPSPDSKLAILEYRLVGQSKAGYQLEIQLVTGRKHQIRAQLGAIGSPIVGDSRYGARTPFARGIALHCRKLILLHPTLKTEMQLVAPLPEYWRWE